MTTCQDFKAEQQSHLDEGRTERWAACLTRLDALGVPRELVRGPYAPKYLPERAHYGKVAFDICGVQFISDGRQVAHAWDCGTGYEFTTIETRTDLALAMASAAPSRPWWKRIFGGAQ